MLRGLIILETAPADDSFTCDCMLFGLMLAQFVAWLSRNAKSDKLFIKVIVVCLIST
jgi:hypothetical protein